MFLLKTLVSQLYDPKTDIIARQKMILGKKIRIKQQKKGQKDTMTIFNVRHIVMLFKLFL